MSDDLHLQLFELKLGGVTYREAFQTGAGEIIQLHGEGQEPTVVISDTPRKVMAHHFRMLREAMVRNDTIEFRTLSKARYKDAPDVPKPKLPGAPVKSPISNLKSSVALPTDEEIYTAKISGNTFPHKTTLSEARFFYRREWGNGEWRKHGCLAHNLRAFCQMADRLGLNFDWERDLTSKPTTPQQQELANANQDQD